MSDTITGRTDRDDFQATRDPALMHGADSGQVNLLSYTQLYELWERQQWRTQDLDFTRLLFETRAFLPSVIQLRLDDVRPTNIGEDVLKILAHHSEALRSGAIIPTCGSGSRCWRAK